MPYSHKHKAIFLHIPKTGGTTIEQLLDIQQFLNSDPQHRPTPQHYTSAMLRQHLGEVIWQSYYKFTLVRNPWARLLSTYFWRQQLKRKRPVLPFHNFVEYAGDCVSADRYYTSDFDDHFIPQSRFTDGVDDVYHYESYASSIEAAAVKLGQVPPTVPEKIAKPYDQYREYYSDKTRALAAEIYSDDIINLGYSF